MKWPYMFSVLPSSQNAMVLLECWCAIEDKCCQRGSAVKGLLLQAVERCYRDFDVVVGDRVELRH